MTKELSSGCLAEELADPKNGYHEQRTAQEEGSGQ